MKSSQAILQIKNSLNKLDSKDYQNIQVWQMQEAVNTEALRFCRRRISSKEANEHMVDDLQILLKQPVRLSGSDRGTYFLSHKLPADYFAHSKVVAICSKGNCSGVRIKSNLTEDSNTEELLSDWSSQPSFDFEQAFHSLASNKIKQFHNRDFGVDELELSYYRRPQFIEFPNAPLPTGGIGKDMTWEFKDDICDMIIEGAVGILAGNISDYNRQQLSKQETNIP